jgi:hypothetical protein
MSLDRDIVAAKQESLKVLCVSSIDRRWKGSLAAFGYLGLKRVPSSSGNSFVCMLTTEICTFVETRCTELHGGGATGIFL